MSAIDYMGKIYGEGSANARDSVYDNSDSTLQSTNVNDAIDEVDGKVETVDAEKASKSNLSDYILTGTKPSTALSSGTFFVDKDGALRVATSAIATTDDVGNGNSAVKTVGEVLKTLNDYIFYTNSAELSKIGSGLITSDSTAHVFRTGNICHIVCVISPEQSAAFNWQVGHIFSLPQWAKPKRLYHNMRVFANTNITTNFLVGIDNFSIFAYGELPIRGYAHSDSFIYEVE